DAMVRKLLYEAANSILTRSKRSFALKTWALKVARRRGLRKARVALARTYRPVPSASPFNLRANPKVAVGGGKVSRALMDVHVSL
ncbi:MAG: hypothetical protein ACFB2Z_13305, partial [Maricaulaceae bacterium]